MAGCNALKEADGGGVRAPKQLASCEERRPAGRPYTAFPHAQTRQTERLGARNKLYVRKYKMTHYLVAKLFLFLLTLYYF